MLYTQKPEGFIFRLSAVGCFIESNDKILLLFRNQNKPQGLTWGMPAGKLEKDEDIKIGMSREILEETGIYIPQTDLKYVAETYVCSSEYNWVYHIFRVILEDIPEVMIDTSAHSEYVWISPKEALVLQLLPGTDECINLVYA